MNTEQIQVLILCILDFCLVILSLYTNKRIITTDRKFFIWFIFFAIFLLVADIGYFINQFIFSTLNINLLYFIPDMLWIISQLIYWGLLVKKNFKVRNNWLIYIAILLVDCSLLFMLNKFHLKLDNKFFIHFKMFEIFIFISECIILNLTLYAFICSVNIGMRLIAAGSISLMGASFISSCLSYFQIDDLKVLHLYLWIASTSIFIIGLVILIFQRQQELSQFSNFVKSKSIRSITIGWTLCLAIFSITIFLLLANYFSFFTYYTKSILPYIMFGYIIFAILMSFIISYVFESSIKKINNTIKSFITKPFSQQSSNNIDIDEFIALNDVFIYTMNLIIEKNKKEELNKLAAQVAHDIASPLYAMSIALPYCDTLPEDIRILLKQAISRISDISGHLLNHYKPNEKQINKDLPTLVSMNLIEIVAEKKYEYKYNSVQIKLDSNLENNFEFIKLDSTSFKRMISNLINNAVESIVHKSGIINISFIATEKQVQIKIQDNGKGMSEELVNKIKNNIPVTEDKDKGHGVGFMQIRESLERGSGTLLISSQVNHGTEIMLTFPRIEKPNWIIDTINLNSNDIVIVLDDDQSIHTAWDTKFLKEAPTVSLKHYTLGDEVIEYVNALTPEEKNKIFLLTDYELLKQDHNGLQILEQLKIKRAILVTSYYDNVEIQQKTKTLGSKILPKGLAFSALIRVTGS